MPIEVVIESLNRPEIEVDSTTQQEVVIEPSAGGSGKKDPYIVSNLTTDLEQFTKSGVYHIILRFTLPNQSIVENTYVLYVLVNPNGIVQVLADANGYKVRVKSSDTWGDWSDKHLYAFSEDIERIVKLAKKAIKTAKAAL